MSYIPTNWQSGDIITSAKLNKMEQGIANGGGLPTPTAADVGAGLTVQATPVPGAVVVPEQAAAWDNYWEAYMLTNGNAALFVAGAKVVVTVDNFPRVLTVEENEDCLYATTELENGDIGILYDKGEEFFYVYDVYRDPMPETVTVSCYLVDYTYSWAVDPYAGYDVVIKLDVGNNASSLNDSKLHLMKGSYADAMAKAGRGQPISAFVYSIDIVDEATYYNQFHILEIYADTGYHDAVEIRIGSSSWLSNFVRNAENTGSVQLHNATTTAPIPLYLTESGLSVLPPWS